MGTSLSDDGMSPAEVTASTSRFAVGEINESIRL